MSKYVAPGSRNYFLTAQQGEDLYWSIIAYYDLADVLPTGCFFSSAIKWVLELYIHVSKVASLATGERRLVPVRRHKYDPSLIRVLSQICTAMND